MFSIEKYIFQDAEIRLANDYYVHPFYQTAFCRLYGLNESEVKVKDGFYPKDNYDFLLPVLRELAVGRETEVSHFYDVRTTEEFLQPAPEYALLKGAGLPRVSPLGVKGMGAFALPFSLVLAELSAEVNRCALVLCSEIFTPADGEIYLNSKKCCGGFLLRKYASDSTIDGYCILAYRYNVTREDVDSYKKEHFPKDSTLAVYEGDSLMDSLSMLDHALKEKFSDFLSVWKLNEKYGLLHISKR